MPTRRAFLSATLAVPVAVAVAPALAQVGAIGAVRIETGPLVRQGWGARAAAIRAGLERAIRAQLGGSSRGGATLVVTVKAIQLSSYAGYDDDDWPGAGNTDYFESEVAVVSGGRTLARYPVMSAVSANSAGPWNLPDIDDRRLAGLIRHNAAWIARYARGG